VDIDPAALTAFGQSVRHHRANLGISQEAFADRCGLDRTYIGGIERGQRNVTIATILRLATALEIPVTVLLKPLDDYTKPNRGSIRPRT
jgi:transcriptional regulator with XRE-family HTH domain